MIFFLKLCFKNIYRFVKQPAYRKFYLLALRIGDRKRNESFSIKLNGKKFIIIDSLSFIWQYRDIFVEEFYYFDSNVSNPVIFDVGSNIGTSIIYFKKLFPSAVIMGFEPDPIAFDALKNNIAQYEKSDGSINLNNLAAWVHDGGAYFDHSGPDSSSVSEKPGPEKNSEIKTVRLKDLIEKEKHIDFIKMDIEGAENMVLKDCAGSLNLVERLFVEYHSFPGKEQALEEILIILKTAGFRVQISSPFKYRKPFVKKSLHPVPDMDLQINIFAYRLS